MDTPNRMAEYSAVLTAPHFPSALPLGFDLSFCYEYILTPWGEDN